MTPGRDTAYIDASLLLIKGTIQIAFEWLGKKDSVLALSLRRQYDDTLAVLREGRVDDVDWDELSDLLDALTDGLKGAE